MLTTAMVRYKHLAKWEAGISWLCSALFRCLVKSFEIIRNAVRNCLIYSCLETIPCFEMLEWSELCPWSVAQSSKHQTSTWTCVHATSRAVRVRLLHAGETCPCPCSYLDWIMSWNLTTCFELFDGMCQLAIDWHHSTGRRRWLMQEIPHGGPGCFENK